MFLLFMSVANYQNRDAQIMALTYVLSISSNRHIYSEYVSLNYHRPLSLFPDQTAFQAIRLFLC